MDGWILDAWEWLSGLWTSEQSRALIRAVAILICGLVVARLLRAAVLRFAVNLLDAQQKMLFGRGISYSVIILAAVSAMRELGFDMNVLLGTAGILTVAIGFASQTSASNLISGLFLIAERSFVLGDVIRVGNTTGVVIAIDLISIKLRTFDNLFVRIPNETVLKAEIVNLSRFPIRRFDLMLSIDYSEDISHVRRVLLDLAEHDPYCLVEPAPEVAFVAFGASSMDLRFSVWMARENYVKVRDSLPEKIKNRFDEEDITIPFPQQALSFRSKPATRDGNQPEPPKPTDPTPP